MHKVIIQAQHITRTTKSPIHSTLTHQLIEDDAKVQKTTGRLHLCRNLSVGAKDPASRVKSRAVLVAGNGRNIDACLQEMIQEIEYLDRVQQLSQQGVQPRITLTVVFSSIAMAQSFCNLINKQNQGLLILYIESVTVLEMSNPCPQTFQNLLLDSEGSKQVWVQIPHCLGCLDNLQPEVTGISIKCPKVDHRRDCIVCQVRSRVESTCSECPEKEDNWVCMICGVVGCGRYKNADAFKHYTASKHILSLDLKTNRVWNYNQDCFSHRVLGKEEGLMDMSEETAEITEENAEVEFWKYCSVVSEQLERQRNFYNKIKQEEIQRYTAEESTLEAKMQELLKIREERKENLKKILKKNRKAGKKLKQLQQKRDEEREINRTLQNSANTQYRNIKHEMLEKRKKQLIGLDQQIASVLSSLSQV